jgi:hypothetical protein
MDYTGAGRRVRTDDLLITNQLLYQLSYAGIYSDRRQAPMSRLLLNLVRRDRPSGAYFARFRLRSKSKAHPQNNGSHGHTAGTAKHGDHGGSAEKTIIRRTGSHRTPSGTLQAADPQNTQKRDPQMTQIDADSGNGRAALPLFICDIFPLVASVAFPPAPNAERPTRHPALDTRHLPIASVAWRFGSS